MPRALVVSLAIVAVLAVLWLLDRLLLRAEARGWIYYRKKQGTSSRLGSAFLEFQSLLEPDKRHMAEVRREKNLQAPESGTPPGPEDDGEPE